MSYRTYTGEVRQLSDRIVPPANCPWIESNRPFTSSTSLTIQLFTPQVCQQLREYQFTHAELIGQKYNDLAAVDFRRPKWQNRPFQMSVAAFDNPQDYRHGQPIVQLGGKTLAMFASSSPKLPIGSTFVASIAPSPRGSALVLTIDPDSVKLPHPQPDALPGEIEPHEETSAIGSAKEVFKSPERSLIEATSRQLHEQVAQLHEQTRRSKLRVTPQWTAFVNQNGECYVRNQNRDVIFSSNLKSGCIQQPLSPRDRQLYRQHLELIEPPEPTSRQRPQIQLRSLQL